MNKETLYAINGVEIFSAGKWNGDEYSVEDLDGMVDAFNNHSESLRPFLKLGHSEKQKLLQEDGMPAAGWIGKVYRKGEKLVADFIDLPEKIYKLIQKKSYRKVSSEIYVDVKVSDKQYKYMLGAVALLGADTPGVGNLSDILSNYSLTDFTTIKSYTEKENDQKVKKYAFENEDFKQEDSMSKTEAEIKLELELKAEREKAEKLEADVKKFTADSTSTSDALKKEVEAREAAEKKVFELEQKNKEIEVEAQVDKLVSEKLITKAMRPFALALLKDEPKTRKFSIKTGDKEVEHDKLGVITEMCKLFAKKSDVNFEESSEDGKTGSKGDISSEAIEKFAAENKLSYSAAYKQMLAGKLTPETTETED